MKRSKEKERRKSEKLRRDLIDIFACSTYFELNRKMKKRMKEELKKIEGRKMWKKIMSEDWKSG